ncbi:pilus assembly protein N-terminal domain-containing protein [Pseudovibrio exalbescens]|uniref:pilus assembly protein N-terminal domain-containing protein n=1 Tax=Pseudovibrio exalbescens TaxID=197461 RepID=UPI002366B48D|nr:pilus assembly protein N-terminal domain-containing protein [Pseudovibrio exalbescens]MDD7910099.1 pilus assembly protein N-terminal domain-containing protein [Pseudovibrio exalbescens]
MHLEEFVKRLFSALVIPAALAVGSLSVSSAVYAKEVSVYLDQAKVFRIDEPASTIILGNPAIADVTLHDRMTIVVTGKSSGVTNIIVLNEDSEPIVDDQIVVRAAVEEVVSVQRNAIRSSYSCKPDCDPVVRLGDGTDHFDEYTKQIEARNTLGKGGSLPQDAPQE